MNQTWPDWPILKNNILRKERADRDMTNKSLFPRYPGLLRDITTTCVRTAPSAKSFTVSSHPGPSRLESEVEDHLNTLVQDQMEPHSKALFREVNSSIWKNRLG